MQLNNQQLNKKDFHRMDAMDRKIEKKGIPRKKYLDRSWRHCLYWLW